MIDAGIERESKAKERDAPDPIPKRGPMPVPLDVEAQRKGSSISDDVLSLTEYHAPIYDDLYMRASSQRIPLGFKGTVSGFQN